MSRQTNGQSQQPLQPPQHQNRQPGLESEMVPRPVAENPQYQGSGKLANKRALITGGDSGIGRAVAIAFAKEGADVAILYLDEHDDARETQVRVEELGRRALVIPGDIGDEAFCKQAVQQTVDGLGGLDILVNNAAEQHPQDGIDHIDAQQLERTFRTNVFSFFHLTKAALPHLPQGGSIINTTSVTAYKGNPILIDYSATKGAIVSFTRALSQSLIKQGIRVNGVAPGPIWTPLIPSTFDANQVASFGSNTPMGRAGQPAELAASYVFLASADSSYISGQVLHPNGGEVING
ncbi:SDR family oxidoreductase [Desmospora profundinema]|uniref:NAD(P)-dependent dehydrogenase (Short-subunit alcohol dehydrogenase family) n=1 Tax=Desmospora profundinema TaxID=1571184 RepID=A0ABU1IMF0_9BACL|nr:SDR family oxidoreductase [Desmospora profundinema]MDR6225965.1 NAD(P)-dependent dehydrogenase (short-subunit alcohol dehydrogenase family) [Desmospora profundinema]